MGVHRARRPFFVLRNRDDDILIALTADGFANFWASPRCQLATRCFTARTSWMTFAVSSFAAMLRARDGIGWPLRCGGCQRKWLWSWKA